MSKIKKGENTIPELMDLYKKGNLEARDKLIEQFLPHAKKWAKDYFDLGIENEDILSSAYEGLLLGVTKYKENVSFNTNIFAYIKYNTVNNIKNFISLYYGLPKHKENITITVLKAKRDLTKILRRTPSKEEIQEKIDVELEEINYVLYLINRTEAKDLLNMALEELREVKHAVLDPEYERLHSFFYDNWVNFLDILPLKEHEKEIIKLRIKEGKTLREISKKYGLSKERIKVIETKALNIIKSSTYFKNMLESLGGEIERNAIENEIIYTKSLKQS